MLPACRGVANSHCGRGFVSFGLLFFDGCLVSTWLGCPGGYQTFPVRRGRAGTRNSRLFFRAEDGIRDVERSRGLGDVYKRQMVKLFTEFHVSVSVIPLVFVPSSYSLSRIHI